jgi:hypothetical protein
MTKIKKELGKSGQKYVETVKRLYTLGTKAQGTIKYKITTRQKPVAVSLTLSYKSKKNRPTSYLKKSLLYSGGVGAPRFVSANPKSDNYDADFAYWVKNTPGLNPRFKKKALNGIVKTNFKNNSDVRNKKYKTPMHRFRKIELPIIKREIKDKLRK